MDVENQIQTVIAELRSQRPTLNFRDLRAVERRHVRLRERVLVPANRSVSAAEMVKQSSWPQITVLPLTIYHHNLIVTWTDLAGSAITVEAPTIDWRYFYEP